MSGRGGSGRERKARAVSQKRKAEADPAVVVKTEDDSDGFAKSGNTVGTSSLKSEQETRWEWLNDGDVWMAYAAELSNQINQAFNAEKQTLILSPALGVSLQVDFRKMIQKNKKTGYQREIRLAVKENDQYFVWKWQSDDGYWVSYDAKSCILLEAARQDERVVSLSLGGTPYTVDLTAMVQKNNKTQHERKIQRCVSDAADQESDQPKPNVLNGPTNAKRPRKNKSVEAEEDSKEQVRILVLKGKAPVDLECSSKVGKAHVFCEGDDVYDVMLNQEGITRHYERHQLGEEHQYQLQEQFHQPSLQYHSWLTMPDYNSLHNPQVQVSSLASSEAFQNETVDLRKSPDYPHQVPTHSFLEIDNAKVQNACSQRKSTVWDFFHLKDPRIGIRNATSAFCNLCTREVKRGSTPGRLGTTAMRNHLAKHHQREWSTAGSTGIITAPISSRHHYPLATTSQTLLQEPGFPLLRSVLDICYCFFATVCTLCGEVISQGETVGANRENLMLQHMQSFHCSILKVSLREMQGTVGADNTHSSL